MMAATELRRAQANLQLVADTYRYHAAVAQSFTERRAYESAARDLDHAVAGFAMAAEIEEERAVARLPLRVIENEVMAP